jgi:hypothetical protein
LLTHRLLLIYAALNAILYSGLLPLWEGFDEPFHFGYVQHLANGDGLPDARTGLLSKEITESLRLAPAAHPVKRNLPWVVTYSEYFSWPPERRAELQRSITAIPRDYRWQPGDLANYEAHHAPLAYLLLAIPERLLGGASLPVRLLVLRWLTALAGALLLYTGARRLCREAGLPEPYASIVLFCVLSSQMTWATIAHVANDGLAVPLAVWMLALLLRAVSAPSQRTFAAAAVLLAAGLLTKAYFLAFVPLLLVACMTRLGPRGLLAPMAILAALAGPWYLRNYLVYGTVSGMQEARSGVAFGDVVRAIPAVDWPSVIVDTARTSLWTANNTFRTFSVATIDLILLTCTAGVVLWVISRKKAPEWVIAAYCALFVAALAFASLQSFAYNRGASPGRSPWFSQPLLAPLLVLAMLGASRFHRAGRIAATLITILFGYVLAATYVVKLIPLYTGYEGTGRLSAVAALYRGIGALSANRNSAALLPAWLILTLTACIIPLAAVIVLRTSSKRKA